MLAYDDIKTVQMLDQIYGKNGWKGINTSEKRECWKYGYDNPNIRTGKFSDPDTEKEVFHPIGLGKGNENITDDEMDVYYICLGQMAQRVCLRCGHTWSWYGSGTLPGTCPNRKCRSPYWNKPRTKKVDMDALACGCGGYVQAH